GLRGRKSAKKNHSAILADECKPLPRFATEPYALEPRRIVAWTASVGVVLRPGRAPKIVPAVVCDVSVAVVDRRTAPASGHIEPRQLVFAIHTPADLDRPIMPSSVAATGQAAESCFVAETLTPAKFAAVRIVMQQFAQPRAGQSRRVHGCLVK